MPHQNDDRLLKEVAITTDTLHVTSAEGLTQRLEMGSVKLVGWEDYLIANLELGRGVLAPDFTEFKEGYFASAFHDSSIQEGFGDLHILHTWVPNTPIHFHIHWSSNEATPTGNVCWKMDWWNARGHATNTEAYSAKATVSLPAAPCAGQYFHTITEDPTGILDSTIETDTLMLIRIYRDTTDPLDTLVGDAFLFRVDAHVQVDNMATTTKASPFIKV